MLAAQRKAWWLPRRGARPLRRRSEMHRSEREPFSLFGKAYFWSESASGNLVLVSVASLGPLMEKVNETLAKLDQING